MGPFLLIAGALVLVGLAAWWSHVQEQKRLAALAAWCASGGWAFDPEKIDSPSYGYDLFEEGHSRYQCFTAEKRLAGATPELAAAELRLFEYHYAVTRRSGKNKRTSHYEFTCALVDPGVELGAVALRREDWGDKLAQAFGSDDIDFEDPEFSKRYVVQAKDRKDAYDLIDGAMMRYLCTDRSDYTLETRGRELLVYIETEATAQSFQSIAHFVGGFLEQLPRPLVNAERARRGEAPLIEAGNASTSSRERLDRLGGRPSP